MSSARVWAGPLAVVLAWPIVEVPEAHAGPATQSQASSPAHPVWESNKAYKPGVTKHRPVRRTRTTRKRTRGLPHEVPPPPPPDQDVEEVRAWSDTRVGPNFVGGETAAHLASAADEQALAQRKHARAEQAYQSALALLKAGKYEQAVEQLDIAVELDPAWSAPLKLRADTFGELARRYRPSETFLSSQAADLQRLVALEPNVDVAARQQQLAELRRQSGEARQVEARRRNMTKPALILGTTSAALIVGGVLLACFYPSTDIDAVGQRRYVYGGVAMAMVGVALAPPAIALGVLAGRQNRRDHLTREFNAYTGREQPTFSVAPRYYPGGGGLGVQLRF